MFEELCYHVFLLQMVVVWNTAQVTRGGEVAVLAKAHTDVDIQALKIAFFDDTRYHAKKINQKHWFWHGCGGNCAAAAVQACRSRVLRLPFLFSVLAVRWWTLGH